MALTETIVIEVAKSLGTSILKRIWPPGKYTWQKFRILHGRSNPQKIRAFAGEEHDPAIKSAGAELKEAATVDVEGHQENREHLISNKKWKIAYIIGQAEKYWGRTNPRARTLSSWYYVKAAEFSEALELHEKAALYYHFAGNQFRTIGLLDNSVEFYAASAVSYLKASLGEGDTQKKERLVRDAVRSRNRAVGVSGWVGEPDQIRLPGQPPEPIDDFIVRQFPRRKTFIAGQLSSPQG